MYVCGQLKQNCLVFPKEAMNPNQRCRDVHTVAVHIFINLQLEYTQTVCSNHGEQTVNNLNSNASLSVGSNTVYNESFVLMQAIG